jgi:anti-sigma factor RsiW
MKHILDLLESKRVDQLSESERSAVYEHISECSDCHHSFQASNLVARMTRERAAAVFDPSPFFHTRVMAAVREARVTAEVPVLTRLWRSAGLLASSMAATVATLAVLTFFAPSVHTTGDQGQLISSNASISAEDLLFQQNEWPETVSDAQLMNVLYEADGSDLR